MIPDQATFISTISHSEGGTTRWTSPEFLNPEQFGLKDCRPTRESDCYALGMVIYEVLSGETPFAQYKNTVVILKVMDGECPRIPQGTRAVWFTDGLWEMLELCWKSQPRDRPSLKTLLQCLEGLPQPPQLPSPTHSVGEGVVIGVDGPWSATVANLGPTSISSKTSTLEELETGGLNLDEPPPCPAHTVILPSPQTRRPPPAPGKSSPARPKFPQIVKYL